MKKFFCILVIVFFVSGCSNEYKNWKKVDVPDVGSIMIPQDWTYNIKDSFIYFYVRTNDFDDKKMCLTGIICNPDDFEDLYQHVDKTMKYVKNISSETLSNSAIIGKNNYLIDGKENEKLFLDIYSSDKQLYIVSVDDSVSYAIVRKIGESYRMNVNN